MNYSFDEISFADGQSIGKKPRTATFHANIRSRTFFLVGTTVVAFSLTTANGDAPGSHIANASTGSSARVIQTRIPVKANPMSIHYASMRRLHDLKDNWDEDGAEAPNALALSRADLALNLMTTMGFTPTDVLASVENGVGITFEKDGRYADIEFFNDGEIAALTDDFKSTPKAWEINEESEIQQALEKIQVFLNGKQNANTRTLEVC